MQLIDKEAVANILKKYGPEIDKYYYLEIMQGLLSLPTYGEWISVKERLPEINMKVICLSRENTLNVMRLDKWESWSMQGEGYSFEYITHWQPLPLPPSN